MGNKERERIAEAVGTICAETKVKERRKTE